MATRKQAAVTGPAKDKIQQAAFESLISKLDPRMQNLARKARKLITDVMPNVIESVWAQQGTSSYGTGPKKLSEHFTFFVFGKSHLSFGFYYGTELDDRDGILEGTGSKMRHVKISTAADLTNPALHRLLKAATTHRVPPAS